MSGVARRFLSSFVHLAAAMIPTGTWAAPIAFSGNGHFYEFIHTPLSWQDAKEAATAQSFGGQEGHLATITSAEENDFILATFGTGNPSEFAWIGGNEPADDGIWQWSAGPEAGSQFSIGAAPTPPFNFAHWGGIEPNDNKPQEDFLMFNVGLDFNGLAPGRWADAAPIPSNSDPVIGYIVEYEGGPLSIPILSQWGVASLVLALLLGILLAGRRRRGLASP